MDEIFRDNSALVVDTAPKPTGLAAAHGASKPRAADLPPHEITGASLRRQHLNARDHILPIARAGRLSYARDDSALHSGRGGKP